MKKGEEMREKGENERYKRRQWERGAGMKKGEGGNEKKRSARAPELRWIFTLYDVVKQCITTEKRLQLQHLWVVVLLSKYNCDKNPLYAARSSHFLRCLIALSGSVSESEWKDEYMSRRSGIILRLRRSSDRVSALSTLCCNTKRTITKPIHFLYHRRRCRRLLGQDIPFNKSRWFLLLTAYIWRYKAFLRIHVHDNTYICEVCMYV